MRVLQLIPSLQNGGAEKFVCELSNYLVNNLDTPCDIAVMYDCDTASRGFLDSLKNVKCICLHKTLGFSIKYLIKLFLFIKRNKYDVVHAHLNTITYLILSAFLLPNVKFIATIHSDAHFEASGKVDKLIRKILFQSRRVTPITISERSNQSFINYYGLDAEIIYNGISSYENYDNESIKKLNDEIIFIHPASCQPVKNQKMLLSVFQKLTKKYKNVYLYWFGSVTHNQELFCELKCFFSDNIKYCGCVNDIRSYLKQADAMCLSSTIEGMPMVIIEAFSVGCIPIVTPAGGCFDMVQDGINGFISETFTEEDYYNKVETFILLRHSEKAKIQAKCMDAFNNYSINRSAELYLKVYKS